MPPTTGAHARLALAFVLLACSSATAQEPRIGGLALIELLAATGLECEFAAADSRGTESADAGTSALVTISYRGIALSAGTATGGDAAIGGDVRIIPSNLGLHFYQFDASGELSLVTVSAVTDESGHYGAVLSRHHTEDGELEPSQLSGRCTAFPAAD